jgi:hypothetical protein
MRLRKAAKVWATEGHPCPRCSYHSSRQAVGAASECAASLSRGQNGGAVARLL